MPLSKYLHFYPELGERVYIAPGAQVVGQAFFADDVSIWHNAVVRADVNQIVIGAGVNVQDLSMLHVTEINDLIIGEGTSIGHSVVMHGCHIGKNCLIGMGSIILDGAIIGNNCVVAAGSLVAPGKKYPDGSMIRGRPAELIRPLTEDEKHKYGNHFQAYLKYKETYLKYV
jgi:carbonic anhydrase/acetyltransferase-like protein (isoleucine patch superfamily)